MKGKQCVLVLGMHRSGTSAFAGVLSILGVDFGKNLMPPNEFNENGYFENMAIFNLNEEILKKLGSSWDDLRELPSGWLRSPLILNYKENLKKIIQSDFKDSKLFGIKDPRITLLLPLYLEVFQELKIDVLLFSLERKDIEIAKSLITRDKFSLKKSLLLIKKYDRNKTIYSSGKKVVKIDFDDLLQKTDFILKSILKIIGVSVREYKNKQESILEFLTPKLKHHNLSYSDYLFELAECINLKESDISRLNEILTLKEKEITKLGSDLETLRNLNYGNNLEINNLRDIISAKKDELNKLNQEKIKEISTLNNIISIKENEFKNQLNDYLNFISEKDGEIDRLKNTNEHKDKLIIDLNKTLGDKVLNKDFEINHLKTELRNIKRSISWKASQRFEKILFSIIPSANFKNIYFNSIGKFQYYFNRKNSSSSQKKNSLIQQDTRITNAHFQPLIFKKIENPELSIIIPVYNQWDYTYNCLKSILENSENVNYEIIIGDDCSNDLTKNIGKFVKNIKVIHNKQNLGFVENCNNASKYAAGKYILFLNNDTIVLKDSLRHLLNTINGDLSIGAVGGKILFPNNTLQEAGCIVWNDGSCSGYGRGDDPLKPEYNFVRSVDYCSGAFILTRRDLFLNLGKFDPRYRPAYYEEVDFCMRLKKRGYKIIYQPLSQIIHYEFVSSHKTRGIKLQIENKIKFFNKWKEELTHHYPNKNNFLFNARIKNSAKNILFIDDRIPNPRLGSGYPRSNIMLNYLIDSGYNVTFYPMAVYSNDISITEGLQQKGMEVIYSTQNHLNFEEFFKERKDYYDFIFVSRPQNMSKSINIIKKSNSRAKIIYDAEAIFSLREILYQKLIRKSLSASEIKHALHEEINLCRKADRVISVSGREAEIFRKNGINDVMVISHEANLNPTKNNFEDRKGILFVGGILSEEKNPNFDAVQYFVKDIFPNVVSKLDCDFYFVGTNNSEKILKLNGGRVKIIGSVENLSEYYNKCRLFVVPTRFSAGIPLKAVEAASYGIPIVMSKLSSEQLGWKDNKECLVANDSKEFVKNIIKLYNDKKLWKRLRDNSLKKVDEDYNSEVFKDNLMRAFKF